MRIIQSLVGVCLAAFALSADLSAQGIYATLTGVASAPFTSRRDQGQSDLEECPIRIPTRNRYQQRRLFHVRFRSGRYL